MAGINDRWLQKLWRKACLKMFKNRCFFCGVDAKCQEVEVHHVTKRNMLLLKHDYRNGIPSCKWNHEFNKHLGMPCHKYAETPMGKKLINDYLDGKGWLDYLTSRSGNSKQWLLEHGLSRKEFLEEKNKELHDIIKGEEDGRD